MGILQALQSKLSSLNRLGVSEPRPTPLGELLGRPVAESEAELDQHFIKIRQASTQRACYLECPFSSTNSAQTVPTTLPSNIYAKPHAQTRSGDVCITESGQIVAFNTTNSCDAIIPAGCQHGVTEAYYLFSAQRFADEVCNSTSGGGERSALIVYCDIDCAGSIAFKTTPPPPTTLPPPTNATQSTEPGTAPTTFNIPVNTTNATDFTPAPEGSAPPSLDIGTIAISFATVGALTAAGMVISALACKACRHWYPKTQMHTFNTNRPAPSVLHIPEAESHYLSASSIGPCSDLGAGESDIELKEEVPPEEAPPPDYDTLFAVKQEMAQWQAVTDV